MAFIDEDPPSMRPRGLEISRPAARSCGTVWKSQSEVLWNSRFSAAGMWISSASSGGPASSSRTRVEGFSVSRSARTHPALPAPTMT